METFTWTPDYSPQSEEEPRVLSQSYGDGYTQRVRDGINTILPGWELTFSNRTMAVYQAIRDFLRARGGVEAFLFTPPGESTARKVICPKWTLVPYDGDGGAFRVTASFQVQP